MSGWRYLPLVLLFLLMICSSGTDVVVHEASGTASLRDDGHQVMLGGSYTPHSPINITSNADFASQGWPGSGTEGDPYVIAGLNITDSSVCVNISNTDVYFEIRNCLVSSFSPSSSDGVVFYNVTHGTVKSCVIELHYNGVHLLYSPSCLLTNNTAVGNGWIGFWFDSSGSCTLTNNTAASNDDGFYLRYSSSCVLTNNTATSNSGEGFWLDTSDSCILKNNTATGNYLGFYLFYSDSCTLMTNILSSNGLSIQGNSLDHWVHDISDNTVNDRPLGYFKSVSDMIIQGDQFGQVILANCSGVTVRNGVFISASMGIQLGFSTNCTLTNNTATGNGYGFDLYSSSNCTLVNNTASSSYCGFYLQSSFNCTLMNNTASTNDYVGFGLRYSGSCTLTNNTATRDNDGFDFYSSSDCTLANNTASGNVGNGFYIRFSSNCILTNNTAASNTHDGFSLDSASNCTLMSNTAGGNHDGFFLNSASNCTLTNNTATSNTDDGFSLDSSSNCTLANNMATSNDIGFVLYSSSDCALKSNIATNNDYGFYLSSSDSCILTSNTFNCNGLFIFGTSLGHWIHDISDNTVNDRPLGYFKSVSDMIIQGGQFGQVILANCSGVTVRNGVFINASVGIQIGFSMNCTMINNTASGNHDGFWLRYSSNCTWTNNTAISNSWNGFGLYWSNSCILTGNTATSNHNEGFGFWYFDSCTLTNNTATSNTYYGFGFSFSTNCTLMDNTAGGNGCGIRLGGSSTGNLLFLNQLFNSTQSNGCDDGSSNSWDNGTHGNFWDDYDGSGTYPILGSAGSVDNHPYVIGALVDTTPPTIDSPSDIEYEHGTTDHSITWTPDDLNPQSYAIYLNGTEVRSGAWNSTSETITISVDGLAIGAYNYTVVLHDTSGNSANDTVLVTVVDTTAPTIDHPSDLVYETGTLGHWITWSPSDPYPDSYEVLRNGTPLTSAPWDGSTIAISVDGLSVGVYNYTVLVTDTHSNLASDTVLVTVFAVTTTTTTATTTTTTDTTTSTTSTTTTTTTTTTGTDMIGGQDPMVLLITAGAIGGVVVVLLVIYIKRSR